MQRSIAKHQEVQSKKREEGLYAQGWSRSSGQSTEIVHWNWELTSSMSVAVEPAWE